MSDFFENLFIALTLIGAIQIVSCNARMGWELGGRVEEFSQRVK